MNVTSYQQFAIVQGDTAQQLTDALNTKLQELRGKGPRVTFEGLIARISYTETTTVPETLADEYELQGVRISCEDCPYFETIRKADGTEDRRIKYGNCQFAEYGRTFRDSAACKLLFTKLNNGEVGLCIK